MFTSTGKLSQDKGNGSTRNDFGIWYTFFGFELTPNACDGRAITWYRMVYQRINIYFAACAVNSRRYWKWARAGTSSTVTD